MTEPVLTLEGHGRKVGQLVWHPTASDLLFSNSTDLTVRGWNINNGQEVINISAHPDAIYCMSFNEDGSKFVTTCKDKKLRIFDTRSGEILKEEIGHEGSKAARCLWLPTPNKILTTGFSKMSERQYILWDDNLQAIKTENIDTSAGVLMSFWDDDIGVLYLAGKGDGNIRYFEINDDSPHVHFLSEYKSSVPQRGMGFMPKRGVNVAACEINRFYKLHSQTTVEPISMIVPRKSDSFQDDLFPETQGDQPSLTADEFLSGKNAGPLKISLRDGFVPTQKADYVAPKVESKKTDVIENPSSSQEYQEGFHKLKAKNKALKDQLATKDIQIRQLEVELKKLRGE
jgi:coronin-1B/1C/6